MHSSFPFPTATMSFDVEFEFFSFFSLSAVRFQSHCNIFPLLSFHVCIRWMQIDAEHLPRVLDERESGKCGWELSFPSCVSLWCEECGVVTMGEKLNGMAGKYAVGECRKEREEIECGREEKRKGKNATNINNTTEVSAKVRARDEVAQFNCVPDSRFDSLEHVFMLSLWPFFSRGAMQAVKDFPNRNRVCAVTTWVAAAAVRLDENYPEKWEQQEKFENGKLFFACNQCCSRVGWKLKLILAGFRCLSIVVS